MSARIEQENELLGTLKPKLVESMVATLTATIKLTRPEGDQATKAADLNIAGKTQQVILTEINKALAQLYDKPSTVVTRSKAIYSVCHLEACRLTAEQQRVTFIERVEGTQTYTGVGTGDHLIVGAIPMNATLQAAKTMVTVSGAVAGTLEITNGMAQLGTLNGTVKPVNAVVLVNKAEGNRAAITPDCNSSAIIESASNIDPARFPKAQIRQIVEESALSRDL